MQTRRERHPQRRWAWESSRVNGIFAGFANGSSRCIACADRKLEHQSNGSTVTSLLRRNLSGATLFQLGADASWLFIAVILALHYSGKLATPSIFLPAFVFAVLVVSLNGAFGLYRRDTKPSFPPRVLRAGFSLLLRGAIAFYFSRPLPPGAHVLGERPGARRLLFVGL